MGTRTLRTPWIGLLAGLALATLVVAWEGLSSIASLLGAAGLPLLLVAVFSLPNLALSTCSWLLVFPSRRAPRFRDALHAIWVGGAVNTLLPVASVGGEAARVRVLQLRSIPSRLPIASVIVDKTVQAASLVLLALVGACAAAWLAASRTLLVSALAMAGLLAIGLALAVAVLQRGPIAALQRPLRHFLQGGASGWVREARRVDRLVRLLYRRRAALAAASSVRLIARLSLAGELWFASHLMGVPIGLGEAVLLLSLGFAVRGAAFFVPSGVGVQEGSYLVVALAAGLPGELGVSLSLASRLRELIVGVPGLIEWQRIEGVALLGGAGRVTAREPAREAKAGRDASQMSGD